MPSVIRGAVREAGFATFPYAILSHRELTSGAKLVYGVLLNRSWQGSHLSQNALANELAISKSAVRRHVGELVANKLVRVEHRAGLSNGYILI